MEGDVQDESFDDADLDDLPPNTLQALEEGALLSKQQKARPGQVNNRSNHSSGYDEYVQNLQNTYGKPPSSDYGFEDEDVIDLDAQQPTTEANFAKSVARQNLDEATAREQWRQQRYAAPSKTGAAAQTQPLRTTTALPTSQNLQTNGHAVAHQQKPVVNLIEDVEDASGPPQDVNALYARISELEQERATLHQLNEDSRSTVLSKAGEIAIVRANQDKMAKEYERRMAEIQRHHMEENAKHQAELEAARKDREKVETDNRFLEHDLAQEAERVKTVGRTLKDGHGNAGLANPRTVHVTTPKKNKSLPFRDGFNDEEVVMLSPSKAKERSKPSTPKAGSKRKRPQAQKSPSKPLSFSEPQRPLGEDNAGMMLPDVSHEGAPPKTAQDTGPTDGRYEFVETVLDSWSETRDQRSMEALTRYMFPSAPTKSLASLLLDALSPSPSKTSAADCRLHFCETIMSLWKRCLNEQFYDPLHDLIEFLHQIIILSPSSFSPMTAPKLVPLCLATSDLIAVPTAKASRNPSYHQPPSPKLKGLVDPLDYLNLLHWVALNCDFHPGSLEVFWSSMEFDFVLLMLHKSQPLSQIIQMLHLLATSILPTSFGAIIAASAQTDQLSNAPRQSKNESDIVDRLTVLLFEIPEAASTSPPEDHSVSTPPKAYSPTDLLDLRSSILALLKRLCFTAHGGRAIATHRLAIGRLVRFLHDCVVAMYKYTPETHGTTTSLVNETVMLLGHLTACHADVLDMRARLAAVPAGSYKHLVALSRVAFAEGASVIEEGIDSEAAEQAHRMLDEHLSPEEGEAVISVFSSGR